MAKPANVPRLPSTGRLIWHQTPICFLDTGLMPVVDRIDMPSCDRYRDADTPGTTAARAILRRVLGRAAAGRPALGLAVYPMVLSRLPGLASSMALAWVSAW